MWPIISTQDTDDAEDFDGGEGSSDLDMYSSLFLGICVVNEGWLVDPKTMRTVSQLPSSLRSQSLVFDSNFESLAIGTQDGLVYVLHFPPEVFQSLETRSVERNSRLRVVDHRVYRDLNKDSELGNRMGSP